MLTFANVVRYLLEQELLDESAVVEGDLTVTDRSRRHHNFMVEQSRGPCFLLKEGGRRQGGATVRHEATVYDFFQDAAPPALDDYLPACFGYHHERQILSLELFRGARNLREHHVASGRFSMALAGQVGKALGILHSSMSDARTKAEFARRLPSQDPWVFAST
jgi:hypothetical protein